MSCALIPYAISLSLPKNPSFSSFAFFTVFTFFAIRVLPFEGWSSANSRAASRPVFLGLSNAVQMELLFVRQVSFLHHPPFPCRDLGHHIRQDPQRIQRRNHRDTQHVSQGDQHEGGLQLAP